MKWEACSYGAGKRHWFVAKRGTTEEHTSRCGTLIWYGSYEAAKRVADKLNEAHDG